VRGVPEFERTTFLQLGVILIFIHPFVLIIILLIVRLKCLKRFLSGFVIDRVRRDGKLNKNIHLNESLWNQFPVGCDITGSVGRTNTDKISLHKAFLITKIGRHSLADVNYIQSMGMWQESSYSKLSNMSSLIFKVPKNQRYWLRINHFKVCLFQSMKNAQYN
jgi:hypothetical protein